MANLKLVKLPKIIRFNCVISPKYLLTDRSFASLTSRNYMSAATTVSFLRSLFLDCVISLALTIFYILSSSLGLSFHIKFNLIPLFTNKLPEAGLQRMVSTPASLNSSFYHQFGIQSISLSGVFLSYECCSFCVKQRCSLTESSTITCFSFPHMPFFF